MYRVLPRWRTDGICSQHEGPRADAVLPKGLKVPGRSRRQTPGWVRVSPPRTA
jgi:hypothetical protein